MSSQYLAVEEEAVRGTTPASSNMFVPITGKIEPDIEFKDEARSEYRGNDTRLGNLTVVRKASSYKLSLEMLAYPIAPLGLFLKHAIGFAGTRAAVETTGYKGMLYPPAAFPYGTGNLGTKAISLKPNTDIDGTTKAQIFGGARIKGFKMEAKRPDDIKFIFDFIGGPWIGAPGQTAIAAPSFTTLKPYNSADLTCYVGAGITRTGSAPAFTAFAPNTMSVFQPDDLTITFDGGIDDDDILNGLKGPSKTVVKSQVKATVEFTLDFTDPASGFSSYDEFVAAVAAPKTNSFLFKLLGPDLAGDTSVYHTMWIDIPNARLTIAPPERDNTGKTPKMKFKYETLYDATTTYPIGIQTIDQVSAY